MFVVEGTVSETFKNSSSVRQTKEKPEDAPKKASEFWGRWINCP